MVVNGRVLRKMMVVNMMKDPYKERKQRCCVDIANNRNRLLYGLFKTSGKASWKVDVLLYYSDNAILDSHEL